MSDKYDNEMKENWSTSALDKPLVGSTPKKSRT